MSLPRFGAGLWHFASYVDRYATDGYAEPLSTLEQIDLAGSVGDLSVVDVPYPFTEGVSVADVKAALEKNGLEAIGVTPEIYMRRFRYGAFTNPDAAVRAEALAVLNEAADVVRQLGASYLKVWPGQDGWDYPFQVDHKMQWDLAVGGMRELALANPDIKMVIEYKPREPRGRMFWDSAAKTALGIKATHCSAASPPPPPRSSSSTTACCGPWTSTTTSAAGMTTSWSAPSTPWRSSSSSTP